MPILPLFGIATSLFMLINLPIDVLILGFVLVVIGLGFHIVLKCSVNESLFCE